MASYRVSYSDDAQGTQVTNDHAVEMDADALVELMRRVLRSEGSFVNVEDPHGGVLTVLVEDSEGGLLLDVPSATDRGSYTKHTRLEDCLDTLRAMGGRIDRAKIDGLAFERW